MNRAQRRQATRQARGEHGGAGQEHRPASFLPQLGQSTAPAQQAYRRGVDALREGRSEEALGLLGQAIELDERNPTYYLAMATAVATLGRFVEAEARVRVALLLDPRLAAAHGLLGKVLWDQGRVKEGAASIAQAAHLAPNDPEAQHDFGCALQGLGRTVEAIDAFLRAIDLAPNSHKAPQALAQCLSGAQFSQLSPKLLHAIEVILTGSGVDKQSLVRVAIMALKLDTGCGALIAAIREGSDGAIETGFRRGDFDAVLNNRLFHLLLQETVLTDPEIEVGLTALRRAFLADVAAGQAERCLGARLDFLCSLSRQCFNNEYVYAVTSDELAALDRLQVDIEDRLTRPDVDDRLQATLAAFSLYRPLAALPGSDRLPASEAPVWSAPLRPLIKQQLDDVRAERDLAAGVEAISSVEDDISRAVKAQYEENPYPRWLSTGSIIPQPLHVQLRGLFPHFTPPMMAGRGPRVLVAGCGTGKQAISAARRFRNAQVLAIDLSAASLAYGMRRARELGVANITFRQGDILALETLDDRFDVIECTGVLHHMRDPLRGWRILADLLKPGGAMKVALYSAHARVSLNAARDWLNAEGFSASTESIRDFRRETLSLPEDDPRANARQSQDFYTTSACRDLLFHVQEHRFTLPEIGAALERLGLDFIGFEFADHTHRRQMYRDAFPNDPEMTDLACWQEMERRHPNLFSGMYQFWCHKA